ncbi:MAG: HIT domain-containing protein [Verrucomicrobia bacterium]|nr:HIT domain-containing protein [Verrucomicrobiota bacterium]
MKQMWAPWRMDYILQSKEQGCFICRIIHGDDDRNNLVLKRGEHSLVLMNRYPYNNGHLMVAPYRHIAGLEEMTPDEASEMMSLTTQSVTILRRAMKAEGFNVGLNLGDAAGAGLREHIHNHIVPRWTGDTNFMPVLGQTKVIPQSLTDLHDLLHPLFQE